MSTGNEGMYFALGHMQGKKYRKRRKAQPPQESGGCLTTIVKGFLWLAFWGSLTLVMGAPIITFTAS